jgi:ubiquitin
MIKILIGILTLSSLSCFATQSHTEAEIQQITKATQEYMKVGHPHSICDDKVVAEARIDLSGEVSQNDQLLVTHGSITFRCQGQTKWEDGEACEFNKDTSVKDSLWTTEYCDT